MVATALPLVLLGAILAIAAASDFRSRRIPNSVILVGTLCALSWHAMAQPGLWAFDPEQPGGVGLIGSLGAGLAVLLAFLPLYALRFMGAGDVKLLACVGCVYGASTEHWSQLPVLALAVLLGGGILAVVRMLALGKSRLVIANIKMVLLSFMIGDFSRNRGLLFDPATDSADRMPYAFAIGLGSVGYAAYSSLGGRVPVSF